MSESIDRRRYYPGKENVTLSVAVTEMVHESDGVDAGVGEFILYEHIDPDALDRLFAESTSTELVLQFELPSATVEIGRDDGIDICVANTDT